MQRSNQDWLLDLRGMGGTDRQVLAHQELARYLHTVVYNYLVKRQPDLDTLAAFDSGELASLAQDFTQETLERLSAGSFALLDQYKETGRFLSWAARIAHNQAAQELRRPYWTRRRLLPELNLPEIGTDDDAPQRSVLALSTANPAGDAIRGQMLQDIGLALQACLDRLPETRCIAFWQCIVENRDAAEVAGTLGLSRNAVYLHVLRAKRTLGHCLQEAHLGVDVLEIFEDG